jgi:surface antigen
MFRAFFVAAPLLLLALPLAGPASAQNQGAEAPNRCEQNEARRQGSRILGSALGGLASRALGRTGVPGAALGISIPVGSMLTEAIIARLDCKEQQQAATATQEAVRGGVGTTATWSSETRANVSGSSTVTAQSARADGGSCLTVNDVIIVEGEETTVQKTMCRAPGASGYVLAA